MAVDHKPHHRSDQHPARTGLRAVAWALRHLPGAGRVLRVAMRAIQPKFSAGAVGVLFDASGSRVFLVEHIFHPAHPWGLPGGWVDRAENPAQTVEREFHEETSLTVRARQPLLVVQSALYRRHMDVVFLCETVGPDNPVRLSHELLDWAWVPVTTLPPLAPVSEVAIRAGLAAMGSDLELGYAAGPDGHSSGVDHLLVRDAQEYEIR